MEVVYECCCGMDVHKDKIVACIMNGSNKEVRSFETVMESLIELVDWLKAEDC